MTQESFFGEATPVGRTHEYPIPPVAAADAPTIAQQAERIALLETRLAGLRREAETAARFLSWLNMRGGLGLDTHATLELVLTPLNELLTELSRPDAQQAADILVLRRRLAIVEAAETYWQQQHADAWKLIGRLDYTLEEIGKVKTLAEVRRWTAKMRAEITADSSPRNVKEAP